MASWNELTEAGKIEEMRLKVDDLDRGLSSLKNDVTNHHQAVAAGVVTLKSMIGALQKRVEELEKLVKINSQ